MTHSGFSVARFLCVFFAHKSEVTPERGGQPLGWLHDPIGPTRDICVCRRCGAVFVTPHFVRLDSDFRQVETSNVP
jgi:hypothetical protein